MNNEPLPKINLFDHKELIEKMNKPSVLIFGRGSNPLKYVPPVKLDQSKHNPEEDMIAFSLYPYMNLAKELLESIEGSRSEVRLMEEEHRGINK